jgi:hypothetical protein
MTERSAWAYGLLGELGFSYSSSVLPAANPLFGWPGFGERPRQVEGILELPVTLLGLWRLAVPFAAGVYLRNLPCRLIEWGSARQLRRGMPVVGYLHPYDLDVDEAASDYPLLKGKPFYRWLMFRNRHTVIGKLERVLATGFHFETYSAYVTRFRGRD